MPGRLLGFVRTSPASSSTKLDIIKVTAAAKSEPPTYSLYPPAQHERRERPSMEHLKRHSLGARHSSDKKSPRVEPTKPAKMDCLVESPPLVLYNNPQNSQGALFSCQLKINVIEPSVVLESFRVNFNATVTTKKPVAEKCHECATQTTTLKTWELVNDQRLKLTKGEHSFPISYLLPGHLPATTHGSLAVLDYHLAAEAKTSTGESITFKKVIDVKRAIIPGSEKHSVRIFPPTNLTAHVTLPPVIYPIGEFTVQTRMSGISQLQKDAQLRWRLRKMNWRIEEHQKMVSPACPKHASKLGGSGKGVLHEDTRVIGSDEVKTGWKTDYGDGTDGNLEVEFQAAVNPALNPICDVESPNGLTVTHNLVVEMVVAEEWAPRKRPDQATPTGAARVLRTQFNLVLTERAGLGIAWDEEQPPVYEDVPASPPNYAQIADYSLTDLNDDIDHLHLS